MELYVYICIYTGGGGIINLIYKKNAENLKKIDIYLICGIMVVNVYAEIVSLFFRVGKGAIIGLVFLVVLMLIIMFKQGIILPLSIRLKWEQGIVLFFSIVITAFWTLSKINYYDTYLYHAQAIHWIEEYGVVKGLGNLHNRLAYDSAFMCYQALFSFKWLLGQSLHAANGFICVLFLTYAILTNGILHKKKLDLSDLFKCGMVYYIVQHRTEISSANTDMLPMLLAVYIFTKWAEFEEGQVEVIEPWAFLCIFSVYGATVKLSVAALVIFTIYPLALIIKNKKWFMMIRNLIGGFLVALPFLVRNVIISGYLLYPYPQIDLFSVDWKMLESVATFDKREIIVWGRAVKDVKRYQETILEWLPEWYIKQTQTGKILFIVGSISTLCCIIYLFELVRKKKTKKLILVLTCLASLCMWFFTAPLMRYGQVYLVLPICITMYWIKEHEKCIIGLNVLVSTILILLFSEYVIKWKEYTTLPLLLQQDYEDKEVKKLNFENITVYVPVEGDQSGYHPFPSTPYEKQLEMIELRGDSLQEGFKVKDICKGKHLQNSGKEW